MSGDKVDLILTKIGGISTNAANNNKKAEASNENIFATANQNETEDSAVSAVQPEEDTIAAYKEAQDNLDKKNADNTQGIPEFVLEIINTAAELVKKAIEELAKKIAGDDASKSQDETDKTQEAQETETKETDKTDKTDKTQEAQETETKETDKTDKTQEAENNPEENTKTLEVADVKESESEDGTKSTETTYIDGSVKLVQEKDGIKTETNYDSKLYPQSKVIYDEEGSKKSETTYKYDENEPEKSWEYTTQYDEEGNIEFTSETENVYPQEEGYKYGAGPASGPDTIYPDPTGKGYKYGTELLPTTSETTVKDAQGEVVKTISTDNEKREAIVEYPDGSKEYYSKIKIFNEKYEVITSIQINYLNPYGERYKMVTFFPGLYRHEIEYDPSGSVTGEHYYTEDGTQID